VFCEGPKLAVEHVFIASASRIATFCDPVKNATPVVATGAMRPKPPEIEIYATNQDDGK
jgi:hypothetical protein